MLNWYRALASHRSGEDAPIHTPTLILWGDRDTALDASLAEESAALCTSVEVHHFAEATHWVHHERADEVNARLIAFLAGPGPVA